MIILNSYFKTDAIKNCGIIIMGYIIIMDCLILVSTVHTIYLKTVSLKIVVDTVVVSYCTYYRFL